MKKLLVLCLILCAALLLPGTILADGDDDAQGSPGCLSINGVSATVDPVFHFGKQLFAEDDKLELSIVGVGIDYVLRVDGSPVAGPVLITEKIIYTFFDSGDHEISVEVSGSDITTTVTFDCDPALPDDDDDDDDNDDDDDKVTICHIPPGNPNAKHTIRVGAPAVSTHLGHGDTRGACDPEDESSNQDLGVGITIFVVEESDSFEIYGDCDDDDNCVQVISVDFKKIKFKIGDDIEIDRDDDDDWHVVVYYLHPDPVDDDLVVYQINIYKDNVLQSDGTLLFVDLDGDLVFWATHKIWLTRG